MRKERVQSAQKYKWEKKTSQEGTRYLLVPSKYLLVLGVVEWFLLLLFLFPSLPTDPLAFCNIDRGDTAGVRERTRGAPRTLNITTVTARRNAPTKWKYFAKGERGNRHRCRRASINRVLRGWFFTAKFVVARRWWKRCCFRLTIRVTGSCGSTIHLSFGEKNKGRVAVYH